MNSLIILIAAVYQIEHLNPAKSEILWCASARRQHQIPTGPVWIGNTTVLPVSQVQEPGLPGRGRHYESACYCDRQSVFLGAATDTKCATFPTTPRLADLD